MKSCYWYACRWIFQVRFIRCAFHISQLTLRENRILWLKISVIYIYKSLEKRVHRMNVLIAMTSIIYTWTCYFRLFNAFRASYIAHSTSLVFDARSVSQEVVYDIEVDYCLLQISKCSSWTMPIVFSSNLWMNIINLWLNTEFNLLIRISSKMMII